MKRIFILGGIAVMIMALALPAVARGPGWARHGESRGGGPGDCPQFGGWGANLTDEQRSQLSDLGRKFYDNTAQLRNQIWTKRGELRTVMSSPNADPEKARAIQKERSDLQAKMAQERLSYSFEVRKINPDARFGAMGYGGRHGGYGMGFRHGRGQGGGPAGGCWN